MLVSKRKKDRYERKKWKCQKACKSHARYFPVGTCMSYAKEFDRIQNGGHWNSKNVKKVDAGPNFSASWHELNGLAWCADTPADLPSTHFACYSIYQLTLHERRRRRQTTRRQTAGPHISPRERDCVTWRHVNSSSFQARVRILPIMIADEQTTLTRMIDSVCLIYDSEMRRPKQESVATPTFYLLRRSWPKRVWKAEWPVASWESSGQ